MAMEHWAIKRDVRATVWYQPFELRSSKNQEPKSLVFGQIRELYSTTLAQISPYTLRQQLEPNLPNKGLQGRKRKSFGKDIEDKHVLSSNGTWDQTKLPCKRKKFTQQSNTTQRLQNPKHVNKPTQPPYTSSCTNISN